VPGEHCSTIGFASILMRYSRRGTPLPPFPEYTHGPPGSGLLPYRFIHDAITQIAADAPQHREFMTAFQQRKAPYDARSTTAKCITTNGGDNYHPSGLRNFTLREFASMQMFPDGYWFSGSKTKIIKQIGNAIPPKIWMLYVKRIVQTLEDFDDGKIDSAGNPSASNPSAVNPITPVTSLAGPSNSSVCHRGDRNRKAEDREQSRTLSPDPIPPTEPQQAQSSDSTPATISPGKRKLNEAFIDLTPGDNDMRQSAPTTRRGPHSRNNHIDLTQERADQYVDLTED
jgi:hypothetical protein